MDKKRFKQLKASIQERGLLMPITFRRQGDTLIVVDGKYRLEACIQLRKLFLVNVIPMTAEQHAEYDLIKPVKYVKLTKADIRRQLQRLKARGYSVKQIAEKIQRSVSWIYRRLRYVG